MPDDITRLTQTLQSTLQAPQTADTLDRQTQILDRLFTMTINDKVTKMEDGQLRYQLYGMEWLELALQIQKQCVETTKAKAAIDYMNGLSNNAASPLPPQNRKTN